MKKIILAILTLILLSCDKSEDIEKKDIVGNWRFISMESVSSNIIEIYPYSDISIEIKFSDDSITFFGCNSPLGTGSYFLEENGKLSIPGFSIIEPCAIGDWIETIPVCLFYSTSLKLNSDTLKIRTEKINLEYDNIKGEYLLCFSRN